MTPIDPHAKKIKIITMGVLNSRVIRIWPVDWKCVSDQPRMEIARENHAKNISGHLHASGTGVAHVAIANNVATRTP